MKEPIDNTHEDEQISALYRNISAEQPPAHLDAAILAAAKREVHAKPRGLSPFSTKWTLPFSLAAVIVMSVSVVTLVPKDSRREIVSGTEHVSDIPESTPARQEKNIAQFKMEAAAPRSEPELKASITPKNPQPPAEKDESRQRLASPPAPQLSPPADNEFGAASGSLSSQVTSDESAAGSAPEPSTAVIKAEPQTKLIQSAAKRPTQPKVEEQISAAAESVVSESDDTTATIHAQDQSQRKISRQALGLTAKQTQQQSQQEMTFEPTQPTAAPDVDISPQTTTHELTQAAKPSNTRVCATLNARDCLQSLQCTFVLSDDTDLHYVCRDTKNRCEHGFNQLLGTQQSCESKPDCRFIPGHCECPEGLPCNCQDKNPPQCTKQ
jgi:hypothetical protein